MTFRPLSYFVIAALGLATRAAPAAEPDAVPEHQFALGFQLDLFPTVASAINGSFGYAPQIWLGVDHVRLRLVAAHLEPPDALAFAPEGFENPTLTAFAAIVDYTFGEHFDGFWVCAGLEHWHRTLEHSDAPGTARWNDVIATVGGGYIWRFYENFYLDPWLGVHLALDPKSVSVGPYEYDPPPVVANGSLKVGVFVDL